MTDLLLTDKCELCGEAIPKGNGICQDCWWNKCGGREEHAADEREHDRWEELRDD